MKNVTFVFKVLVNLLIFSALINILMELGSLSKDILNHLNLLNSSYQITTTYIDSILTISTLLLLFYMLTLLIKFRRSIADTTVNSIFTKKNCIIFKIVGNGLIYYSIGIFIVNILKKHSADFNIHDESISYNLGKIVGTALGNRLPLLVIAIFFLVVSQLIKEGYQLKKENDLTI